MTGLSALTWIVVGAAAVGLVGTRLSRPARSSGGAMASEAVDALWMIALSIAGVLAADAIHTTANPA